MAGNDPLKRITLLYHFTDRRNLPLIREHGGLYPVTKLKKKNIEVPAPGGNEWSRDADGIKGMDAYVHLCFRNTHPMEYVARQEGRMPIRIIGKKWSTTFGISRSRASSGKRHLKDRKRAVARC